MILFITVDGFSKLLKGARNVKYIVLYLEGHSNKLTDPLDIFYFFFAGAAHLGSCLKSSDYHGRCLIFMYVVKGVLIYVLSLAYYIYDLSGYHSVYTRSLCYGKHGLRIFDIIEFYAGLSHGLKGMVEQCIPCQYGHVFTKYLMAGESSPSVIIIIQSRKVIMYQ